MGVIGDDFAVVGTATCTWVGPAGDPEAPVLGAVKAATLRILFDDAATPTIEVQAQDFYNPPSPFTAEIQQVSLSTTLPSAP